MFPGRLILDYKLNTMEDVQSGEEATFVVEEVSQIIKEVKLI